MALFSKKIVGNFKSGLSEKVIAKIPNVDDDAELIEISRKIQNFGEKLKEKQLELDRTQNNPRSGPPAQRPNVDVDAEQIINGTDVELLSGPRDEDGRRGIFRQIQALERAILILQNKRTQRMGTAIQFACKNLPSEVKTVFKDVLIRAEALEKSIQSALKIDQILAIKGLEASRRDPRYQVLPFWINLIFGGSQPAMSFIIKNQKKAWDEVEGKWHEQTD
jgi:hypothetical protein